MVATQWRSNTEDDILCKGELQRLQAQYPTTLSVQNILTSVPLHTAAETGWQGCVGRLDTGMVVSSLPPHCPCTCITIYGLIGMLQTARAALMAAGHSPESRFELEA